MKAYRLFLYTGAQETNFPVHGLTKPGTALALTAAQANYVVAQPDSSFVDTLEVTDQERERVEPEQAKQRWPHLFPQADAQPPTNEVLPQESIAESALPEAVLEEATPPQAEELPVEVPASEQAVPQEEPPQASEPPAEEAPPASVFDRAPAQVATSADPAPKQPEPRHAAHKGKHGKQQGRRR